MAKIRSTRRISLTRLLPLISLSLLVLASLPPRPAQAAIEYVKWTRVSIPAEGVGGNWVLAANSDIGYLHMAANGTLYAYAAGLTHTLYQSKDDGNNWSYLSNVTGEIISIATAPGDSSIYYATKSRIYRSRDGGKTFQELPSGPGGAGGNNVEITSLAVTRNGTNLVAVGTRDTDAAQFGGVYLLDEKEILTRWEDAGAGSYDVYAVAFSPDYPADHQIIAVITDETDTLVTSGTGNGGWGAATAPARLDKDNSGTPTAVSVTGAAIIAFPDDYNADPDSDGTFFVGINTGSGNGDVYQITLAKTPAGSVATDLNVARGYGSNNVDISGLDVSGTTRNPVICAGSTASAQTYFSPDGGKGWTRSRKEPTGGGQTRVLMAPDFESSRRMYAATSGTGSAFSVSRDNGRTWNQTGLIDTTLSTLLNLAPSPGYEQDKTLFLLSLGGSTHSLWRTQDDGSHWERIFASGLTSVDSFNLVALPPEYSAESPAVLLAGVSNGSPAVWKSEDNGQNFIRRLAVDPDSGSPLGIDTWAIVDRNTFFIGSYPGSTALVYRTDSSGSSYSPAVEAGNHPLNAFILSPNYPQDRTILVGNRFGGVYWSDDDGNSFLPLPSDATAAPLTGVIAAAFDAAFGSNHTVYAASDTADAGIYRFVIGKSADWESIDGNLPGGGTVNHPVVAADGTLYAANAAADGGIERSLNPSFSLGPTFESVSRGLSEGATLSGLWRQGHRLWSLDTANDHLLTFYDSLTSPCPPSTPLNRAAGIGAVINHNVSNITLDWETLPGASSYEWQLDHDTDFSSVPGGFEGTTKASTVRLPTLEPETSYYWRVRASAPVLSPWAETQSFTTNMDTETISLKLESPSAGSANIPLSPVFQWSSVSGADTYELLVATEINFTDPSIVKIGAYALAATAWQSDVKLNPETTYFWKVRAANHSTFSEWSAVSAFTTAAEPKPVVPAALPPEPLPQPAPGPVPTKSPAPPAAATSPENTAPLHTNSAVRPVPPPPPPPNNLPALIPDATMPVWVIYLVGGLMLTIILLLIITLLLVVGTRRN